ncbi:transcription factor DUO1-like [Rutidosis leptorrhynchoides]|uniref:transcription factor DUO1-like n=1 Tax=Rutidosis leptorrhynchoides TaxID=125765 RepID=UPI003A9902E1
MRRTYDDLGEIKKGPWKAEEDEVLLKHVKKYGPKDWSSIRSKGLLQRTGKSCRLRWVNKLRPNLKTYLNFASICSNSLKIEIIEVGLMIFGVKFSADEEQIVIQLQREFGNKWARIATHLPGRTDNDVKNFWSSRQKRLARVLRSPPRASPPKSQKLLQESLILHKVPIFEVPKRSSSTDGESSVTSPKTLSCSSPYCKPIKMVPLPELMNPTTTNLLSFDHSQLNVPTEENSCNEQANPAQDYTCHPRLPPPPPPLDTNDIFTQLGDPNFFAVFGHGDAPELAQFPYMPPGGEGESGGSCGNQENDDSMILGPDTFIDDFPVDMFDDFEPLPSPSDW